MLLKNKKISQLKKDLWTNVSKAIRLMSPICDICKRNESEVVHHVIKKSKGNSIYFEMINLVALCKSCHYKVHNVWDHIDNRIWIDRILGDEVYLELKKQSKQIKKFTKSELIEKIEYYKKLIKDL